MKSFRIAIGMLLWTILIGSGVVAVVSASQEPRWHKIAGSLRSYLSPGRVVPVRVASAWDVRSGDAIFLVDPNGPTRLVGEMGTVGGITAKNERQVEVILFPSAPEIGVGRYTLIYHRADASLTGILAALLPPAKRNEVYKEISSAIAKNEDQIFAALEPALHEIATNVTPALESALEKSVTRHWAELELILAKHRGDFAGDLATLGKEVGWPLVKEQAEPLAKQLANEIWQRVSLWRFGWRYLYGKTGLSTDALEKEWNRFMAHDALPVIENHVRELSKVAFGVFESAIMDPRTKDTLRTALGRVVADPEFQKITGTILREAILDNTDLHNALAESFSRPVVQKSLEQAAEPLEPTLRRIGDILFGDGKGGLSPELARILRNQVLGKDQQWFTLEPSGAEARQGTDDTVIIAKEATEPSLYPLPKSSSP